jgi:putative photosynthetic complex assembly protein
MSHEFLDTPLPRKALIAVGALIGFSLLLVVGARLTGYNPHQAPDSPTVAGRDLRFADGPGGVLLVLDVADGSRIAVLPPGNAGFIRGILRVTDRGRRSLHVATATPYRLERHADGRLTLSDLGTHRVIELSSFGPSNIAAFAAFLPDPAPVAAQDAQPDPTGAPVGADRQPPLAR